VEELDPEQSASARVLVARGSSPPEPFLISLRAFPAGHTQGWLVGIAVPEAHYLGGLTASRRRLLILAALVMVVILAAGGLALRALRGDLGRLLRETVRLRRFDFAATPATWATFADVEAGARSLEQAKTALRALSKYAPVDLVRQLYDAHREPTLGGRIEDVTLMFTDIEGFTTVSEQMPIDELAAALGQYLQAMTGAIHATGGIIDKYVGDGVMALWNTPRPCPDHPVRACDAALRCREATAALFASSAWGGRPPWRTRFGIHRAEVTVGHFGAPERMSFTAMGDGVNLAARLEGLNKQYGTGTLVSGASIGWRSRASARGSRCSSSSAGPRRRHRPCAPTRTRWPPTSAAGSPTRWRSSGRTPTRTLPVGSWPAAAGRTWPRRRRRTGAASTWPGRNERAPDARAGPTG
jgi:adenylate cyclase